MSLRVSKSRRAGEEGDPRLISAVDAGSLEVDAPDKTWQHRREKSEPLVSTYPGTELDGRERQRVSEVYKLSSRIRPNSEHTPRVTTPVEQPPSQRYNSTEPESTTNAAGDTQRIPFKMSRPSAPSSEASEARSRGRGPPSSTNMSSESRHILPGSTAEAEWDRIQKLRVDNWSLRSQIHEIRSSLRDKQRAKSGADDILYRRMLVQGLSVLHGQANLLSTGQKSLRELMDDCQAARDEYGPLEDECNQLEDQLSGQEFELARLEESFYSKPPDPTPITPIDFVQLPDAGEQDHFASSVEADGEIEELEYHPAVAKYLSRLGDLDLLQERFDDLAEEKRNLEEERESRLRFGLTLDPLDQKWLDGSQSAEDDLKEKILALKKELDTMKQDCFAQGLVDEDGDPIDFPSRVESTFEKDEDIHSQDQTSEYVKYPLLLPRPGMTLKDLYPLERKSDEKSESPTIRINNWMLQKLRMSALDVNLLASTFETISGRIGDHWEISVLFEWFKDGTMKSTGTFRVYTSSMTTQAAPISNPSDTRKTFKENAQKARRLLRPYRLPEEEDRVMLPIHMRGH